MIKPNELRIGNYVQWSDEPGVYVPWMHGHWLGTFNKNYPFPEPVPLTSEWLLKFGFEKTTGLTWSLSHEKTYSVYRKSDLTYNEIQAAWWYDGRLLKKQPDFVHEIQNLHYDLTGEELTIQEKEIEPPMMGMSY